MRATSPFSQKSHLLAIVAMLLLVACVGRHDPDPGNKRLAALKADPARRLVPPGTDLKRETIRPKRLGERGDIMDVGSGPGIVRYFSVDSPHADANAVLDLFEDHLRKIGWQRFPTAELPETYLGPNRSFSKTISGWCHGIQLVAKKSNQAQFQVELVLFSSARLYPDRHETCQNPTGASPAAMEETKVGR